ncbi:MAG TPA: hypothetical protein P5159_01380 [Phycisphaerae bacterium]|nr:hypothetical protein [Phycisphaerae bacterium]
MLERVPEAYRPYVVPGGLAILSLLVLRVVWGRVARFLRRRRPPIINPRLAKYSVDHAELDRKRRELARKIVATSTSARLAGFKIVRQVEAVFVEGYRAPEEALIALKAAAAERGANGILNVGTERTAAGRCSASGDAVIVAAIQPLRRPAAPSREMPSAAEVVPPQATSAPPEPMGPPPPAPQPPARESPPSPPRSPLLDD